MTRVFFALFLMFSLVIVTDSFAGQRKREPKKSNKEAAATAPAVNEEEMAKLREPFRASLLFSDAEIELLRAAAAGRQTGSAPLDKDKVELIPIDRKIRLSGIYYQDDSTWIVWMNGYKLHPHYWLPEIMDMKVKKDEVFLRWYDIGLDGVIDITLRPHQVYDIVTGTLYYDTAGGSGATTDSKGRTRKR